MLFEPRFPVLPGFKGDDREIVGVFHEGIISKDGCQRKSSGWAAGQASISGDGERKQCARKLHFMLRSSSHQVINLTTLRKRQKDHCPFYSLQKGGLLQLMT